MSSDLFLDWFYVNMSSVLFLHWFYVYMSFHYADFNFFQLTMLHIHGG